MSLNVTYIPEEPIYQDGVKADLGQNSYLIVSADTDGETIGVVDGKISAINGSELAPYEGRYYLADLEYVSFVIDSDTPALAAFTNSGGFTLVSKYSEYGYTYNMSGPVRRISTTGTVSDELRVMPDASVVLYRRTAGIRLGPGAPYDITSGSYNLDEYVRYWVQRGVTKTASDFEAWVIAKAASLSGTTITTASDAMAYFNGNPYLEVVELPEPYETYLYQVYTPTGYDYEYTSGTVSSETTLQLIPTAYRRAYRKGYPTATESKAGMVRPDNETIVIQDGVLTAVGARNVPYLDIREDASGKKRLAIVIPEGV